MFIGPNVKIPDTSDSEKMAHIGRMTVLRKARREAAQRLRDKLVPLLNSIELQDSAWNVDGVVDLVEEIRAINQAIEDLN
jgi:hypothetical protein